MVISSNQDKINKKQNFFLFIFCNKEKQQTINICLFREKDVVHVENAITVAIKQKTIVHRGQTSKIQLHAHLCGLRRKNLSVDATGVHKLQNARDINKNTHIRPTKEKKQINKNIIHVCCTCWCRPCVCALRLF